MVSNMVSPTIYLSTSSIITIHLWNFKIYVTGDHNPIFFHNLLINSLHKMKVCSCILIEAGGK